MKDLAALAMLAALLAGCSLQPTYDRPPAPIAPTYPTGPAYATPAGKETLPAVDIGWRDFLQDPRLQQLVDLALANNRDLRVAMLNVAQFRAQYRIERANQLPQVGAGVGVTSSRAPIASVGRNVTTHDYSVGVSAAWEIDLFGKLGSQSDQALQQYFATAQARKAAQMLLVAEVANQYLALLADDELLGVTRRTLDTAEASYRLTRMRFDTGTGTELAVLQAQTVVENARATHAAQVRSRAQAENALVLLVGQPLPADLAPGLPLTAQALLADIPEGLPSDLLARRPDVMQAEANLRGAYANIGAARAAFFPSISLTGSYGLESVALSALFHGASLAWSFIPSLTVPIFEGGRLQANLDAATIQRDVLVAQYEKTIQVAFREVADGLAARGTFDEQVGALQRYVAANQGTLDIAQLRFQNGVDSYLDVLTAQTNLYVAQQALVQARLARLANLVTLYQSLGGGWLARTGGTPAAPEDVGHTPPPATVFDLAKTVRPLRL